MYSTTFLWWTEGHTVTIDEKNGRVSAIGRVEAVMTIGFLLVVFLARILLKRRQSKQEDTAAR
jgi:hypothetical protein